jgi:hypothetical protein
VAEPSVRTIKRLFALSGNACAFPECDKRLIDPSGNLVAKVCHICADKPGGKRYVATQTDAERQGFDNLIVMCGYHHDIIDNDEITYTVVVLRQMKCEHEKISSGKYEISDETARSIILLMAGGVTGVGVASVTRDICNAVKLVTNALKRSKRGLKRPKVSEKKQEEGETGNKSPKQSL